MPLSIRWMVRSVRVVSVLALAAGLSVPAALPAAVIKVTDANVRKGLSPYNWICQGESIGSSVGGASLAVAFKGTRTVALLVDTAHLAAFAPDRYPILAWSVNGGPTRTHQLKPKETSVPLAEGLADPAIDLYVKGFSPFEDRWTGQLPVNSVRITGFAVDEAAATVEPAPPAPVWLNVGDSIMSGDAAAYAKAQGRPRNDLWAASNDARASYGYLLARHWGCRESRLAFGGYNWRGGMAKVPALSTLIDQSSSETSRLREQALDPPPAVVLVNLGENGVPADKDVIASLEKLRQRSGPAARIIVMIPVSGRGRVEVTRAFEAYKTAASDERTHLVDAGRLAFETADGQHPTAAGHQTIFQAVLPHIEKILGPRPAAPPAKQPVRE